MKKEKALSSCMQICSRKECSKFDILEKLQKWELEDNDANDIVKTLEEQDFINELRFATAYANDKFKFNKWGKIKIRFYLKKKQISSSDIDTALANIKDEEYKQTIIDEIAKKQSKVKAKTNYELKQKVVAYLISKGFEIDLIYSFY